MFDANVPAQTTRKSRWRRAAIAVPVASGWSPSTSASVAASVSGSCSRRDGMAGPGYEPVRADPQ